MDRAPARAGASRRSDLDALRSFAMLLGVALHAALSFVPFPWPVRDTERSDLLVLLIAAVHGFRMPLFFLLSGYFTMLVYSRRGLASLLEQRFTRIFLPLVIATVTIVPLDKVIEGYALRTNRRDPALANVLSGDDAAVRRQLATPGAADRKDAFWGLAPLAWATMRGDPGIVAAVLDAGGDPNERDGGGNTPLHHAAYFGRDAAARLLLERGAEPTATNAVGRMPAAMMGLSADLVSEFAPLCSMDPVGSDEILAGRERLRAALPTGPNPEGTLGGPLDRATLAWSDMLSADWLRVHVGSWSLHLVQTNVFHHLWFLWFLCWLVAAFAILAATGLLPTGRARWWLVAASCVPQLVMGMSMAASYGPDSSFGILPRPHLLVFYACFFFFGVATFAAEGLDTRLGRHWRLLVPAAVALFVAGIATMNDRPLASVLQPAYAWTMSLGLIGLFARFCSRPSPLVSWLADASYWMYLVHPPLVMVAHMIVRPWAMPAGVKFLVVMALVTPVLLFSYRYGVRYTAIGSLLNGPRGIKPIWLVMLTAGAVAWGDVDRSHAAESPPDMRRVADGVRYGRRSTTDPRPLEMHFLEVDLASADVALEAVVADDPDGDGPAEATLVDPERLVSRPGIVAAVNANAFRGLPDASGTASTHWKADMPVTIAGWARTGDGDGSLPERGYHQFWIDAAGRAHIGTPKQAVDAAAPAAIAGFHVILADGRFVEGYREKLHPRTVVGTDATGTRVWLVVVDGRQPGISEGMTYRELAALMQDLGCVAALNLDGGGSSVMLTAGPTGGLEIVNRPSDGRPRPVPVMLAVKSARAKPERPTR